MARTRNKSALAAISVASLEIAAFAAFAQVVVGPALLAARWGVGATGSVGTYLLNRRWAFKSRGEQKRRQARRYALTVVAGVSLGTALWAILVTLTPLDPRLAQVASMMSVWLAFTYPLMARWVFRPPATA